MDSVTHQYNRLLEGKSPIIYTDPNIGFCDTLKPVTIGIELSSWMWNNYYGATKGTHYFDHVHLSVPHLLKVLLKGFKSVVLYVGSSRSALSLFLPLLHGARWLRTGSSNQSVRTQQGSFNRVLGRFHNNHTNRVTWSPNVYSKIEAQLEDWEWRSSNLVMALEQTPAPSCGRGGRCFPEMKNRQLKERAVGFYAKHKVTDALEKLLNELFLAAPNDVYGYMVDKTFL